MHICEDISCRALKNSTTTIPYFDEYFLSTLLARSTRSEWIFPLNIRNAFHNTSLILLLIWKWIAIANWLCAPVDRNHFDESFGVCIYAKECMELRNTYIAFYLYNVIHTLACSLHQSYGAESFEKFSVVAAAVLCIRVRIRLLYWCVSVHGTKSNVIIEPEWKSVSKWRAICERERSARDTVFCSLCAVSNVSMIENKKNSSKHSKASRKLSVLYGSFEWVLWWKFQGPKLTSA